jgi:hypothetical protein
MPPVGLADFEAVIVQPEDTVAEAIVKAHVRFPRIWYQWYAYHFDSDGNITAEFEADLCAIGCAPATT